MAWSSALHVPRSTILQLPSHPRVDAIRVQNRFRLLRRSGTGLHCLRHLQVLAHRTRGGFRLSRGSPGLNGPRSTIWQPPALRPPWEILLIGRQSTETDDIRSSAWVNAVSATRLMVTSPVAVLRRFKLPHVLAGVGVNSSGRTAEAASNGKGQRSSRLAVGAKCGAVC